MDAAVMELAVAAAPPRLDTDRIRDILLVRLAVADKAVPRDMLARDLGTIAAPLLSGDTWRSQLDRDLAALAEAGLADVKPSSAAATEAGQKRALIVLGGRGAAPKSWPEARDVRLIAKALGIENDAPAKLKKLAKPDGLRAAILVKAFKLKLRGTPSPVKLRAALAKIALSRAFGTGVDTTQERSGLSAKAGRVLAGRLASSPKDFKTDSRLIAALAADQASAEAADLGALQLALLRRFVTKGQVAPPFVKKAKRRTPLKSALKVVASTPAPAPVAIASSAAPPVAAPRAGAGRPSMTAFVADVLALAMPVAEGFIGNRRAFISRVWSTVVSARPDWGLTEIEFKCMLAEAHRVGALVLANADLKDTRRIAEIQASALSYKNAVFHYVRVDV